jgi:hypothetical protein
MGAWEWIAGLLQGDSPSGFTVRQWLYLPTEPLSVIMVWEGDAEAEAYVERTFTSFANVHTQVVTDPGHGATCARGLPD